MPPSLDASAYRNLLQSFLSEDLGAGDITTVATVSASQHARGEVIAKAPLVLAGIELFAEVFRLLDAAAVSEILLQDGEELAPGQVPARIRGSARALLSGERVALNLLQRLSGVATQTRRFVRAIEGTDARAVLVGGGLNHRKDLAEAVLIKENHIRLAGGVAAAITAAEAAKGRAAWIEIEVTNLDELRAALGPSPDVILLDNMSPSLVRRAVEQVRARDPERKIRIEASGGITLANVREFAEAGADWISVGALTHSAPAVDLSFEIEPEVL